MTSSRQLKASENIRKILADVFVSGTFISPELFEVSVSITDVKVSPDLQNASVYVYPLTQAISAEELVNRLTASSQKIKRLLAQKLYAKRVPNLIFKYEKVTQNADKILDLIASLSAENK
ncbi:MAG: 30S ribosome-binding factor RbfA [Alphaproteobacteria bacterium]|nr:30S ribosome-binding factor RbfA [Alphaproteobacteria bacterium]OJV17134.1 MAG: ribosome-binding factor A [Alphaproteobacteria bacterium 33-17]